MTLEELFIQDKIRHGKDWVDDLVQTLQESIDALLPDMKDELTIKVENKDTEDLSVVVEGTDYSIDLSETEHQSIVKTRRIPAWQLTKVYYTPSTRDEPDNWDPCPVETFTSHTDAIVALIKAVLADKVDNWFESREENMYGDCIPF